MDILPTIVHEAVAQCKQNGVVVPPSLVTLFLRTQMLVGIGKKDPAGNVEIRPDQVETLVNTAVSSLTRDNSAMVESLRLQSAITQLQQDQVNAFRTDKVQHKAKSQRFLEDICVKKEANEAFNAIALFILHECRLLNSKGGNNPNSAAAAAAGRSSPGLNTTTGGGASEGSQKETIAALESVFPKAHMDRFVTQRDNEKVVQLEEIWRIVWGIRLYNKATGKGGEDVADLIGQTERDLAELVARADDLKTQMESHSKMYAAVLRSPSVNLTVAQKRRIHDEYHHVLQVLVYARSLLETLGAVTAKVAEMRPKWDAAIADARSLVEGSEANPVPKVTVYSKFIFITERWDAVFGLAREVRDATELIDLISESAASDAVASTLRPTDAQSAMAAIAAEKQPNKKLLETEIAALPCSLDKTLEYIPTYPINEATGAPKAINFEFNGFCIVSFVDSGLLLDGKTELREADAAATPGYIYLHANSAHYCFYNERALRSFAKDPFKYLSQGLMQLVQGAPVTVYLLGLHPYLSKEVYLAGTRKVEVTTTVEKSEIATQTGQIDSYKDTHYVWNEWELRRLALQLAALRNKRTHSTQTNLSHFRRDNETQAYPAKEQQTQTLMDAAIQPPRVRQYIKGLRGTETSEIEVVKKTFQY